MSDVQLSFKLSDDFVTKYENKEAPFGFTDAGNNSLGEITFIRTYSRLKADGSKERWYELCRRVIEGMYSIQKDFCKTSRLPWNDVKAQYSAQEAYDRMFNIKWLPPGRGLWMMGTPLVNTQRNSAGLQNCFTGETQIITSNGVRALGDMVDETVHVWADGGWAEGTIKDFGTQPVQRVTFAPYGLRSNHRVVETVTPDHRWELKDGSLTTDLKVGDVVPAQAAQALNYMNVAYIHGLMFADGSINYVYKDGDFSHMMRLCGDKASEVERFTNVHYQPNCDGDPVVYYRSSINMKALPTTSHPDYVTAFVAGWLKFDGTDGSTPDTRVLSTQDYEAVQWLLTHAATAGYTVVGVNTLTSDTNYGPRSAPLYRVTLTRRESYWTVKAIEPLDEAAPVYCAVVPGVERFTLASGVYTSNCAFISTAEMNKNNPGDPFAFFMEALMLGVGVGFDDKGADKDFTLYQPTESETYVIPDTREGWAEALRRVINSYLRPNGKEQIFDYSEVRPAGAPIATFGGTASGPGPLKQMLDSIKNLLQNRDGQRLRRVDVADIGNLIGVCVVAGNVRRSAELLIGRLDDKEFINLKNAEHFPERNSYDSKNPGWSWMSNNSVEVAVGDDLSHIVDAIAHNGEPGVIWMDTTRKYGRLKDPANNKDHRAAGYNPCAEQSLESGEMCTLVETFINRHDSIEDFRRTLKFAFLYAKTVTLLPTHWQQTNAIMQRNRRIGTSISGIANFADNHGMPKLRNWMDDGYETVKNYDRTYSEWLGIRESIKVTTVKPSGTVSILAGESPGVHWSPGGEYFMRTIRFGISDPMVPLLLEAGYKIEQSVTDPENTVVVYFPVRSDARRSEKDVTIFEKIAMAATAQRYWSDNSVSVTVSFDAEKESHLVAPTLHMYDGQLKTVSYLPMGNTVYPQQPYTQITQDEYESYVGKIKHIDFEPVYQSNTLDAIGEAYCTTDVCEIKAV